MIFIDSIFYLQMITLILSQLSGVGQMVVVASSSSFCHRCLQLSVPSFAVLCCELNLMILGLTDHRSDLHFVVLGLSAISGSL